MTNVFPLAVKGISCCRDNTMDMWVETQVLTPRYAEHNRSGFSAKCE